MAASMMSHDFVGDGVRLQPADGALSEHSFAKGHGQSVCSGHSGLSNLFGFVLNSGLI
jgi:hypothetical protein